MTVNPELAAAARRVRALNARLPEMHQVDVAAAWQDLLDRIDGLPDWRARIVIADWTSQMEVRLCSTLLNAPLDLKGDG